MNFAFGAGGSKIVVGTSEGLEVYLYPSGERYRLDSVGCSAGVLHEGEIAAGTTGGLRLYRQDEVVTVDDAATGLVALGSADIDQDGREEVVSLHHDGTISLYDEPGWRRIPIAVAQGSASLTIAAIDGRGTVIIAAGTTVVRPSTSMGGNWRPHLLTEDLGPLTRSWVGHLDDPNRLDAVVVESGTPSGQLSVFSSRDGGETWEERRSPETYAFAASLDVDGMTGSIVVGEVVVRDDGFPRNRRPRLLLYPTIDALLAGDGIEIAAGTGTAQARFFDIDGDGVREIVGVSPTWPAEVQVFKPVDKPSFDFDHRVLDRRERPITDIIVTDIDGDGLEDIVSGNRWYRGPDWTPQELPTLKQALASIDVNGDGRLEIVGTSGTDLSSEFSWLERSIGDETGWRVHPLGVGDADWPHGAAAGIHSQLGPILVVAYHQRELSPPQVWRAPADPTLPWHKDTLADIIYGEGVLIVDLDGDGTEEIIAGRWWFEWDGVNWLQHPIADESYGDVTRIHAADLTGNGRLDVVMTENHGDWDRKFVFQGRIAWFEQPQDPRDPWREHVITMRGCPHSLDVADIDGDGDLEIIVGEHDPFTGEGEQVFCRLSIFKRLCSGGDVWSEHVVDTRFEHHVGTRAIRIGNGVGIVSQGWKPPHDLHLWSPTRSEGAAVGGQRRPG